MASVAFTFAAQAPAISDFSRCSVASAKAKSAFRLGSKSSARDALECPVQMAHTPAQHVFCHDRHAQWMQAAASVHK